MNITFKNSIKMLSSGFIIAIVQILIVNQNFFNLENNIRQYIIDFNLWLSLGLTFSKIGIDQIIQSKLHINPNLVFNYIFFNKISIFLILIVSFFFLIVFKSAPNSFFFFFIVLFDLKSIIIVSELIGKRKINEVVYSNLIRNFSLYFLVILLSDFFVNQFSINVIFLLFSILRYFYLIKQRPKEIFNYDSSEKIEIDINQYLFFQQVLNFFLFKTDSLLLIILKTRNVLSSNEISFLYQYFRFPELISGISTTLTPIIGLKYKNYSFFWYKLIIITLGFTLFYLIFQNMEINLIVIISLVLSTGLVFLVNFITFEAFAFDKIKKIVHALLIGNLFGILSIFILLYYQKESYMILILNIQLLIFGLSYNLKRC